MTILIVDTSIQLTKRFESLVLEAEPTVAVFKASTPSRTLRLLEDCKPDVVILDMDMPAENSFELLRLIDSMANRPYIIALSAYVHVRVIELIKKLGADYFLDKHNEFEQIPAIIKALG